MPGSRGGATINRDSTRSSASLCAFAGGAETWRLRFFLRASKQSPRAIRAIENHPRMGAGGADPSELRGNCSLFISAPPAHRPSGIHVALHALIGELITSRRSPNRRNRSDGHSRSAFWAKLNEQAGVNALYIRSSHGRLPRLWCKVRLVASPRHAPSKTTASDQGIANRFALARTLARAAIGLARIIGTVDRIAGAPDRGPAAPASLGAPRYGCA